ncbi:MAG: hypothetical protein HY423_12295 [Candidatus Lambdaproteobacteria bacterium]|nr:hypothetical protein [Candidatus Lambdaproteobacteria bacterium]
MRAGMLAGGLSLLLGCGLAPLARAVDTAIEVQRVVLAEAELKPGDEQVVQVSFTNASARAVQAGLLIEFRNREERTVGRSLRRSVTLPPQREERVYVALAVPRVPGPYSLRLEVFDPAYREPLLVGRPVFRMPFTVLGREAGAEAAPPLAGAPPPQATARPGTPSFPAPAGLAFEKADLLWEGLTVAPQSVLVGDALKIRAELRNVGGDIARGVEVRVEAVNTRLPNEVQQLATSTLAALAPGEKIELEFEHTFPATTLIGDYEVTLRADPGNLVPELDKTNNTTRAPAPIQVSRIRLVFPAPDYVFQEAGLFLFRWDSKLYDEFKVQVGVDPRFENRERYFDIPQGEKWTRDREVVPLAGELPGMAKGLMLKEKAKQVYWRVVGRTAANGKEDFSRVLAFKLELEAPAAPPGADLPPPPALETRPTPAAGSGRPPPPAKPRIPPPAERPSPESLPATRG